MERLLLWFLEGLADGQGGPQAGGAKRREADRRSASRRNGGRLPAVTGSLLGFAEKGAEPLPVRAEAFGRWRAEAFLSRGPDF